MALKAFHAKQKAIENKANKLDQHKVEAELNALKRPVPPINPRLAVSDCTIEGLGRLYKNGCSRLSYTSDDGAIILEGHTTKNDRSAAVLARMCSLWDGGKWDTDRGAQENNFSLNDRRLSLNVTTQPDVLRRFMVEKIFQTSGLGGRSLISLPDTRVHERKMVIPNWEKVLDLTEYWKRLGSLYGIPLPTHQNKPLNLNPRVLHLSKKAEALYMSYGNECFKRANGTYKPIREMVLKAESNLVRLAATLAIFNNPSTTTIDAEYLEASTYLMNYYLLEGLRVSDVNSYKEDEDLAMADELLVWLITNKHYLVHSQFLSQYAPKKAMRKSECINGLMTLIVNHGHAVKIKSGIEIDEKARENVWFVTS